jgi:hypothetical protein
VLTFPALPDTVGASVLAKMAISAKKRLTIVECSGLEILMHVLKSADDDEVVEKVAHALLNLSVEPNNQV